MRTLVLSLIVSVILSTLVHAPRAAAADPKASEANAPPVNASDLKTISKFIDLLKAGKNQEAAQMVRYPLRRPEPLKPIANANEFVENVGQFFDKNVLKDIESKKSDTMTSWRGTFIAAGAVYADGGKITALNVSTPEMKKAIEKARASAKAETHSSVSDYVGLKFECVTDRHHVQVQDLGGDKIRYVSWPPGNLSKKPELVLPDGQMEFQGTGGNVTYRFKGGDFVYEIDQTRLCGEDCNSYLKVIRGQQVLTKQACHESK